MERPPVLTAENASSVFGELPYPPTVPQFNFLTDLPRGEGETFLLFGGSGTGKTRLLGTCGDRALIISNGNGITTIQNPVFRKELNSNPIIATVVEKLGKRGIFSAAEAHDAMCDTIDFALEKFPERFDFICIDDSTQLRRAALNKALMINKATRKSNTFETIVTPYGVVAGAVQDQGLEMNIVETFISNYTSIAKQTGKHFVMCAHERLTFKKSEKIGDTPELIMTAPAFTGVDKNPSLYTGYFDNVWYTQVVGGGNQRVWRVTTKGHERLNAKTRMDGVFETMEDVKSGVFFMKDAVARIQNSSPDKLKVRR